MNIKLISLIVIALVMRVLFAPLVTLELDFNTFRAWSLMLAENGPQRFYENWSDYLPGYLYVLWGLGVLADAWPFFSHDFWVRILYKLPAIFADLATGYLIYKIVSKWSEQKAYIASFLYLLNPAVWANSTLWGQVDGITSLFSVFTLYLSFTQPFLSSAALAMGTLIKPQAAFIAPLIMYLWVTKHGVKKTVLLIPSSAVIFIAGFIPFAGNKPILPFIFERLAQAAGQYPYTSVNAFNLWALGGGWWKSDGTGLVSLQALGWFLLTLIIVLCVLTIQLRHRLDTAKLYLAAAVIFLASFLFLTRMHERHLLATLAPLAVAGSFYPVLYIPYLVISFNYSANLYYSYAWITNFFQEVFPSGTIDLLIIFNLLSFISLAVIFIRKKVPEFPHLEKLVNFTGFTQESNVGVVGFLEQMARIIIISILIFSFTTRVIGLQYPSTFYFDEVYHAFTAREMLRGDPKAWEWRNTPPEGFAYEWTHPPLAKLGMVVGMKILGEQPLGWRIPGAALGVGIVFLLYLLGKELFKKETPALITAAVFSLDGIPLVLSRIGMNDSYFLFFALLSVLFFLKEKYLFSSVFLGLAAASKWTTLWIIPLLFAAIILFGKKPRYQILWFVVIPITMYFISYLPFFLSGHTLDQFRELQRQMWYYHTNLVATHAFQSQWWTWPFMVRPVWLFNESREGLVANIYVLGNPIVALTGVAAIVIMFFYGIAKRSAPLIFIAAGWGLLFLPWSLSPRIMFLYHYLPAVPFLALALGWWLSKQGAKIILVFLSLSILSYLFFFPHWTGMFVPEWFDNLYYWFPSWKW